MIWVAENSLIQRGCQRAVTLTFMWLRIEQCSAVQCSAVSSPNLFRDNKDKDKKTKRTFNGP
jgi:hypothetical protein